MTITYRNFLKKAYNENKYKDKYTLKEFEESRMCDSFFNEWLEANRNTAPDMKFVNSIVKTYIKVRGVSAGRIGSILCEIQRKFDIQMPLVEGIFSKAYWESKLA
ncbi:hypothetical protein R7P80_17860 [Vibrio sp. 2092]|uniref:hypothetical protein n=1 Tax=Vibrio sp. 2092 TaxID=3074593 RepID=UPI0011904645|nr:hypothetical protein [Vibrio sp. 2092]EGR5855757.1 hypothetical protein [Vibrio parahaemolyticus]MCA2474642.1 hypothetical protein [Vibrio alginolyticus]TVN04776.1 hypothetical protein FPV63_11275 [Vibrio cholerae]ELA8201108.1 hypothetical protein [Vibrio parahaemolyticus]MDW2154669.1 hypothetical protein [Vibrio sp. 2092]